MAVPRPSLTDHQLLTTTSNGCLEREDVYGDALADIPNIVVFVNLSTRTPLLHCISWYDLRAVLEPADVPLHERMRLWRSDETLPSNYVYRVIDRWFDPALEPLSRYYNTFLLYDSYEARVGTQLAVSAIHGATECLHRVRPVHRRDVVSYVRGALTAEELRATLAATVGGLPDQGDGGDTVIFEPEPEDAVRPTVLYRGPQIVLAQAFDGKPFGHATVWTQGQAARTATYDGSVAVGEGPERASEENARSHDVSYHLQVRIPGVRHVYNVRLTADGNYIEELDAPPFTLASEMEVVSDGVSYHMRPRVLDEERWASNIRRVDLRSDPPLDDAGGGRDDPPALVAFRRFIAFYFPNVDDAVRDGELVVQFHEGPAVYWYNEEYIYVDRSGDGDHPALLPPLERGAFDFTVPGTPGRQRVLLRPGGSMVRFRYDEATCRFVRRPGMPPHLQALFEESPHVDAADGRTYLYVGDRIYLVDGDTTYSLRDGNEVYPLQADTLRVGYHGTMWDYDPATETLLPLDPSDATDPVQAPASFARLALMLQEPAAFTVRYAPGQALFAVRRVDGRYYTSVTPSVVVPGIPYDAEVATTPYLLLSHHEVVLPHGHVRVEIPTPLPATWEELAAALQASYPALAGTVDYLELLEVQYRAYRPTDDAIATAFQLTVDAVTYDIALTNNAGSPEHEALGLALLRQGRPVPLPNLWAPNRPLYLQERRYSVSYRIARVGGHYVADPVTDLDVVECAYVLAMLGMVTAALNRQFPWRPSCTSQFRDIV